MEIIFANKDTARRAANQPIPLLPEDENKAEIAQITDPPDEKIVDMPAPRRSASLKKLTNVEKVVTMLSVIFLAIGSPTLALMIKTLNVGITLVHLGPVEVKTMDLPFTFISTLNLTSDLRIIKNQVNDLRKTCRNFDPIELKEMQPQCTKFEKLLSEEANTLQEELNREYQQARSKRNVIWQGTRQAE